MDLDEISKIACPLQFLGYFGVIQYSLKLKLIK